jgi:acyl carrier protein
MSQINELTEVDIKKKVKEFIKNNFLLGNDSKLKDDDSFLEKGIIDSTGVLELVSFIEETFGLKVEDEELIPDNLDSLNKVTDYVQRKKENAG